MESSETITLGGRGPAVALIFETEAQPRFLFAGQPDGDAEAAIRRLTATMPAPWVDILVNAFLLLAPEDGAPVT